MAFTLACAVAGVLGLASGYAAALSFDVAPVSAQVRVLLFALATCLGSVVMSALASACTLVSTRGRVLVHGEVLSHSLGSAAALAPGSSSVPDCGRGRCLDRCSNEKAAISKAQRGLQKSQVVKRLGYCGCQK